MKFFISQAMNGRTDEEIKREREEVIFAMKERNPYAECIDSFFESAPHDAKPLWFLGKSLELLSDADLCIFVDYAQDMARGCKIEYQACVAYGIDSCTYRTDTKEFEARSCQGAMQSK